MAQFALVPPPTKKELEHVWGFIEQKKQENYRTWRDVASAIGVHQSELSRFRRADTERRWGYWRLIRVAKWLGFTLDQMLGRPEGTTEEGIPVGGQKVLKPLLEALEVQALVGQSRIPIPFRLTGPEDLKNLLGDAWPCPHCGRPIDLKKAVRAKRKFLKKSQRRLEALERERSLLEVEVVGNEIRRASS